MGSVRMEGNGVMQAQPPVSAVLLNWKRPYHLPRIIASLECLPFIREILVLNNSPEPLDPIGSDSCFDVPIRVFNWKSNICTFGRHIAAQLANSDIIYTQDDDIVVRNVPQLYERFLSHQNAITAGLAERHYAMEANEPWLLMGWGAFFRKEWLSCIQPWIDEYGEDDLLRSKFDRIFAVMFGRRDPQLGDFERLKDPRTGADSDRDANSLWKQPDHERLKRMAVDRALMLRQREAA